MPKISRFLELFRSGDNRAGGGGEVFRADYEKLRSRVDLLEDLLAAVTGSSAPWRLPDDSPSQIAVILPTRNRAGFVSDAIESVQRQSFNAWTLIIVDDGSTDNTLHVVTPFLADPRIRYIRQEAGNVAAARNRGIEESTESLIAYLDSDNVWFPGHLAQAFATFLAEPTTDLVYTALVSDIHNLGTGKVLCQEFNREALLDGNFLDINVVVHRRSLVDRFGGWDENLRRLSDWDLVLRYTQQRVPKRLLAFGAHYRSRDDQRISDTVPSDDATAAILQKWGRGPAAR